MWGAAPTGPRARVLVAAAIFAVAALAAAPAAGATETSPRSLPQLWAVDVDRAVARALKPGLARTLRRSGVNALVLDPRLTPQQRGRMNRLARKRGLLLVAPLVEPGPGSWSTVLAVVEACQSLKSENPARRCAVRASSIVSARRLADEQSVDLVVVRVRNVGQAYSLANAGGRVLAMTRLGKRAPLRPWRTLARAAHRTPNLDLAISGGSPTTLSRFGSVVESTTKKGDRKAPTAPTNLAVTGESTLTLSWSASRDNRAVTGYTIYVDDAAVGTSGGTSYVLPGLACGRPTALGVDAFDEAGNRSAKAVIQVTPQCAAPIYTITPSEGATVAGQIRWEAGTRGVEVSKIDFLVDGALRWTERNAPFVFNGNDGTWDTTLEAEGPHELTLRLTAADGSTVTSSIAVNVSNGTSPPPPSPPPPPPSPEPPPPPPGDTSPPTTPSGLAKTGATATSISIGWSASTDDVGVTGYRVYLGSTLLDATNGTTYTVFGLVCATTYGLAVEAYDAAGNESARANLSAATAECPSGDPSTASVYLAPSGSDSNGCTAAAPCKSLTRGYQVAQLGDVVELAAGTYPEEVLAGKYAKSPSVALADRVVFRPAPGAAVKTGRLEINVPHVEFRDMRIAKFKARYYQPDPNLYAAGNLAFRNIRTHHFSLNAVHNVSFIGGEVGPNRNPETGDWPQDGIFIGTYPADVHPITNLVIEDVYIHDVTEPNADAHSDCIQFTAGINVTIRNNRFLNCEHADLMIKGDQGPIDGFLIENNFFDETLSAYYSINLYETSRGCRDVLMRNNTALQNIRLDACTGGTMTGTIQPSMSSTTCSRATVKLDWNVYESGQKCGANDVVAPISYVDRATFDLRLRAGSAAINRGNPGSYPAKDIDGEARPRGGAPDAGAHEHS